MTKHAPFREDQWPTKPGTFRIIVTGPKDSEGREPYDLLWVFPLPDGRRQAQCQKSYSEECRARFIANGYKDAD